MKPVFLFGVPRSGTSWFGELFNSSPRVAYRFQPLFSYAFKDAIGPDSSPAEMRAFLGRLGRTDDPFVLYGPGLAPRHAFEKVEPTHLVLKEARYLHLIEPILARLPEARIIGIVRAPQAVLASWRRAPKEFDPSWSFEAEWRAAPSKNAGRPENAYGFDAWLDTTIRMVELAQQAPRRLTLVGYAELLADPLRELERLFAWCDLPLEAATRRFVALSRSRDDGDPYGVFRTARRADEAWRDQLDPRIDEEIRRLTRNTPAARFLPDLPLAAPA